MFIDILWTMNLGGKRMNLMERITGVVTHPKETIEDISENPRSF